MNFCKFQRGKFKPQKQQMVFKVKYLSVLKTGDTYIFDNIKYSGVI